MFVNDGFQLNTIGNNLIRDTFNEADIKITFRHHTALGSASTRKFFRECTSQSCSNGKWAESMAERKTWKIKVQVKNLIYFVNSGCLTWKRIWATTSMWGCVDMISSFMTLVRTSFAGSKSLIIWLKTPPYISAVHEVENLILLKRTSTFSEIAIITSGFSWTTPLDVSVSSSSFANSVVKGWMCLLL